MIEPVTESAPPRYRARALISLGANSFYKGDYGFALSAYREASRFVSHSGLLDPYATVHTQKMVAVINSLEGNHRNALALLENLFPLTRSMRSWHPHAYYDYMNSLAVELCEVGRLEEAKNVSQIVIVSPLAAAYPEWRETREEIELRGHRAPRSVVAFTQRLPEAGNVVRLPAPEIDDSARTLESVPGDPKPSGRVLSLLDWKKKKMPEKSNGGSQRNYQEMSGRELLLKIMELTAESDITDYKLLRIVEAIETILSAPKDPGKQ